MIWKYAMHVYDQVQIDLDETPDQSKTLNFKTQDPESS